VNAAHEIAGSGHGGVDGSGDTDEHDYSIWFAGPARRQRFVSSVREVVDAEGSQVISNEIFRPGPDRRSELGAPLRPETLRDLLRHGYEPSSDHDDHERVWA
jgi:hypothetical protein